MPFFTFYLFYAAVEYGCFGIFTSVLGYCRSFFPTSLQKPCEDPLRYPVRIHFRVPLETEEKRMLPQQDRFDQSIPMARADVHIFARHLRRLVVVAVCFYGIRAYDVAQSAIEMYRVVRQSVFVHIAVRI